MSPQSRSRNAERQVPAFPRGAVPAVALVLALVALASLAEPASAQRATEASATLEERNDSGVAGTVEFEATEAGTRIVVRADGALGDHPTHIHSGTCADLDPNPKYPLNNVELKTTELTGLSETVIDAPLDEFLEEDHLVLIHRSAAEIGNYLACGNIVAGPAAAGTDRQSGGRNPLASTGSGAAAGRDGGRTGWTALGAVAVALAAVAAGRRACTGLRRR